jgi:hypothetical protein
LDAQQRQAEYRRILPFARAAAAATPMMVESRHAEESMIENWDRSYQDFVARRGRAPRKADVFLSHCPCQVANTSPSTGKHLAGNPYPASCYEKLKTFCTTGDRVGMKWTVYFDSPFLGQTLDVTHGNLRICPRPDYILLPS